MTKYTITATDKVGQVASAEFNVVFSTLAIEVVIPELVLISGTVIGAPFKPVRVLSGKSPFVFSISPALPSGLDFSTNGEITGLPLSATTLLDYVITVTDDSGTSLSKNVKIRVLGKPEFATVTPITPASGLETGGTEVTITGANFATTNRLLVDNTAVNFTVIDDSTVKFVTAEHPVGKIGISIATTAGEASLTDAFEFTPAPPRIESISPSEGLDTGGYTVTLTGKRFNTVTDVKFGSISAVYTINSPSSITATVPAHSIGDITITATNAIGTSNQIGFTYIDSTPSYSISSDPASGIFNEGQAITWTITTRNVPDGTVLYWSLVGGVVANDFVEGITSGSVTISAGRASVKLTATSDQTLDGTENFTFQVRKDNATSGALVAQTAASLLDTSLPPSPIVTSVSPTSVWYKNSQAVTITGANFTGMSRIVVRDTTVNFQFLNSGTIRFIPPGGTLGPVNIVLTTPAGTSQKTNAFTYDYRVDGIPSFAPNGITNAFKLTFFDGPPNSDVIFRDLTTSSTFTITLNSSGFGEGNVWVETPIGTHNISITWADGRIQTYSIDVT
jgi:hypothetical protein